MCRSQRLPSPFQDDCLLKFSFDDWMCIQGFATYLVFMFSLLRFCRLRAPHKFVDVREKRRKFILLLFFDRVKPRQLKNFPDRIRIVVFLRFLVLWKSGRSAGARLLRLGVRLRQSVLSFHRSHSFRNIPLLYS
jgi:hypothetical protein